MDGSGLRDSPSSEGLLTNQPLSEQRGHSVSRSLPHSLADLISSLVEKTASLMQVLHWLFDALHWRDGHSLPLLHRREGHSFPPQRFGLEPMGQNPAFWWRAQPETPSKGTTDSLRERQSDGILPWAAGRRQDGI